MTTVSWLSGINGNWSDAQDWSGDAVPQSTDDAVIDAPPVGTGYTVTVDGVYTVNSLGLGAGANLLLSDAYLSLSDGTGSGTITGDITIDDSGELNITGNLDNSGSIALVNGGFVTTATLNVTGNATLTGAGVIEMNATGGLITGVGVLTNAGNTINGVGFIEPLIPTLDEADSLGDSHLA